MDVFAFAMKMEQDGEAFYRELAEKSGNAGLRRIFSSLAEDEAKHYAIFQKLHEGRKATVTADAGLENVKNIFREMRASGQADFTGEQSLADAYRQAMAAEQEAYTLYEQKAATATDPDASRILLAFAREERRHYRLLENVLNYVTRPESWLEDAEFARLDEY